MTLSCLQRAKGQQGLGGAQPAGESSASGGGFVPVISIAAFIHIAIDFGIFIAIILAINTAILLSGSRSSGLFTD